MPQNSVGDWYLKWEMRDLQQQDAALRKMQDLQRHYQPQPVPPMLVRGMDAWLNEHGLVIKTDDGRLVTADPGLMRRLVTLLEMAALAKMVGTPAGPPEAESAP